MKIKRILFYAQDVTFYWAEVTTTCFWGCFIFFKGSSFLFKSAWIVGAALVLWAAFPPLNFWFLAWVGLVPFLLALDGASLKGAFGRGYLFGFLFFVSTLWWIGYVTVPGMLLLVAYLSLYWGAFAFFYCYSLRFSVVSRVFSVPAVYVILEFVRERALTGFGWSSLGHSQSSVLGLIQIADITGVAGVSFVLVMVNVFLKECRVVAPAVRRSGAGVLLVLSVIAGYGLWSFFKVIDADKIQVALIQGNIALEETWRGEDKARILEKYLVLSRQALERNPDLVLWPESAFPPYIWGEDHLYQKLRDFTAQHQVPLLFGAVTNSDSRYYNSVVLLDQDGQESAVYDKRHLVVFGEYIPFRREFPILADIVPIDDFTPGTRTPVFTLKDGVKFSALICFEDTLPWLAREGALLGGSFLVNLTNDAWFRDSPGAVMHLQNSVFRAVENRRALARAANTGVSCLISPRGVVGPCAESGRGDFITEGIAVGSVSLVRSLTFYTKYGDIFTFACFIGILVLCILRVFRRSDQNKGGEHVRITEDFDR